MVDQPEGRRPKSPGGKIKPIAKKHNVSKPYDRPATSRGVLARVKELISPVTPGWLKDLVLKNPRPNSPSNVSVTDALEETVCKVEEEQEKKNEFRNSIKTLRLPLSQKLVSQNHKTLSSSFKNESLLDKTKSRQNNLEDTLGEVKWSSIRPAVRDKYTFNVAAFSSPNQLSNHTNSSFNSFSNRSFCGTSLQRTLLQKQNSSSFLEDKKPIRVRTINRSKIRPGVTSNTAKKILDQLETLSKPLSHLPSSRPSTPGGSRCSTPLSSSRPSTPYSKSDHIVPIKSLTSTPMEKIKTEPSFGGKMKREKRNHYSRQKDEGEEFVMPEYESVKLVKVPDLQPISIPQIVDSKPIKIVNQKEAHIPLKDIFKPTVVSYGNNPPVIDENSNSSDSFSFSAPITVSTSLYSTNPYNESSDFSFNQPYLEVSAIKNASSVEAAIQLTKSSEVVETDIEVGSKEPPGSWRCAPCKLSNPSTMTRCSGCEAPKTLTTESLWKSPLIMKQTPITPMKPALVTLVQKTKEDTPKLPAISEEKSVSFKLSDLCKSGWNCSTCYLKNSDDVKKCIACQAERPQSLGATTTVDTSPGGSSTTEKLKSMDNPLLKSRASDNPFQKFLKQDTWSCDACLLANESTLEKCKACETPKPDSSTSAPSSKPNNPLMGLMKPDVSDADKSKAGEADKKTGDKPIDIFAAALSRKGWKCDVCLLANDDDASSCKACQTQKPGAKQSDISLKTEVDDPTSTFKFGLDPSQAPTSDSSKSAPTFGFGIATSISGGFKFGLPGDAPKGDDKQGFSMGAKVYDTKEEKAEFKFGLDVKPGGAPLFGTASTESKPSTFEFGVKSNADSKPATTIGGKGQNNAKPSFNFGGSVSSDSTPKFNFGGGEKTESAPSFNFGGNEKKDSTPGFNFGGPKKTDDTPAFNFGGIKKEETVAPTFNFGESKKEEAPTPAFNFGGDTLSNKPAPTFNFGGDTKPSTVAPTFNFGGSDSTKSGNLGFSFNKDDSKPSFNFGSNSTPGTTNSLNFNQSNSSFKFGGDVAPKLNDSSGDTMDASSQSPKGFSFGGPNQGSTFGNAPKTVFNFGGNASASTTGNTSQPTFNFGGNGGSNSFGSSTTTPSNTGFNFGSGTSVFTVSKTNSNSTTSAFTFGAGNNDNIDNNNKKPAFNFGGNNNNSTAKFGSSAPASFNTPTTFGGSTPSFGAQNTNNTFNNTPTFGTPNSTLGTPNAATPTFGTPSAPTPSFGTPSATMPTFNFGGGGTPSTPSNQFNTAPGTPSSTNMFNPVSSGTRKIRKAVRRTKR